jgi:hexosaminidase
MLPFVALSVLLAITPAFAIWPVPQHYTTGSTPLRLSPSFSIKLSGVQDAPKDLVDAVTRTTAYLRTDKLQALVPDRGASSAKVIRGGKALSSLTLFLSTKGKVRSISDEAIDAVESRVEGYTLTIPADGSGAVLKANSTLGLFRGLTTFGQLWYDWDGTTYSLEAPFDIVDAPAYVRSCPSHRDVQLANFLISHTVD